MSVQEIDYERLKARLEADGQVLDFELAPEEIGGISKQKLAGIVVDDAEADLTGFTSGSTATPPFVDQGYRHDSNADKGQMRARFVPDLPEAGRYEVRIAYPAHANRANNVRVTWQVSSKHKIAGYMDDLDNCNCRWQISATTAPEGTNSRSSCAIVLKSSVVR